MKRVLVFIILASMAIAQSIEFRQYAGPRLVSSACPEAREIIRMLRLQNDVLLWESAKWMDSYWSLRQPSNQKIFEDSALASEIRHTEALNKSTAFESELVAKYGTMEIEFGEDGTPKCRGEKRP